MKNYDKTFTVTFTANQLADKFLKTIHPDIDLSLDEDTMDARLLEDRINNNEYYTRIVESVLDNIEGNSNACSDLFNALNGWVKHPTPSDKTSTVVHHSHFVDVNKMSLNEVEKQNQDIRERIQVINTKDNADYYFEELQSLHDREEELCAIINKHYTNHENCL